MEITNMGNIDPWSRAKYDDDDLLELAATIESHHPSVADQIRSFVADEGKAAGLLRTAPKYVSPAAFKFWQGLGIHLTPVEWASPIPDTRDLPESVWEGAKELPEIDIQTDQQREFLTSVVSNFQSELDSVPIEEPDESFEGYFLNNKFFGSVDLEVLYTMVREHSPDRIVEVGGGFTTRVITAALAENNGECSHVVIEPHPSSYLMNHEGITLHDKPVQEVPASFFTDLSKNDILFIDSSHCAHIGSDVLFEQFELLPQLTEGVLVHFHDIFLPYEYPREWIKQLRLFFNEQYLLRAFLMYNDQYEVLWSSYYMHREFPDLLESVIVSYSPTGERYETETARGIPASFWMRRCG